MAVAALMSGCLGADEQPRPATGPAREVAQLVQRLERASLRGDWATVCDQLFTEGARARAGGADCARRTRRTARGIERPVIEITAIRLHGARAEVGIRTRARGQAEVADVLELRREEGAWRVEALAG